MNSLGTGDALPSAMSEESPQQLAAAIEKSPSVPPGEAERFAGYGVMGATFSSGHVLALRRFPASSLGEGYTTVWHRSPAGEWTIFSNRDVTQTCPRYFGADLARAIETPIVLSWPSPNILRVDVPQFALSWTLELAASTTTRMLNAMARAMTDRMWQRPQVLAMTAAMASRLLHAGRLGLTGRTPNGQWFIANPMNVWLIESSRATLEGNDLGTLAPLAAQTRLGDFWIPQRALFAFGRSYFEPLDVARHRLVVSREAPPFVRKAPDHDQVTL